MIVILGLVFCLIVGQMKQKWYLFCNINELFYKFENVLGNYILCQYLFQEKQRQNVDSLHNRTSIKENRWTSTKYNTQFNVEIKLCYLFFALLFIFEDHHYENTGISIYNTRGSHALLEEIDPDENSNDADINEFESHNYVNVTLARISLQRLWEYKLQNTANDCINTEFKVC